MLRIMSEVGGGVGIDLSLPLELTWVLWVFFFCHYSESLCPSRGSETADIPHLSKQVLVLKGLRVQREEKSKTHAGGFPWGNFCPPELVCKPPAPIKDHFTPEKWSEDESSPGRALLASSPHNRQQSHLLGDLCADFLWVPISWSHCHLYTSGHGRETKEPGGSDKGENGEAFLLHPNNGDWEASSCVLRPQFESN